MKIEHIIQHTELAMGLIIESLRYVSPAVGLKPSALQCEDRLHGREWNNCLTSRSSIHQKQAPCTICQT